MLLKFDLGITVSIASVMCDANSLAAQSKFRTSFFYVVIRNYQISAFLTIRNYHISAFLTGSNCCHFSLRFLLFLSHIELS